MEGLACMGENMNQGKKVKDFDATWAVQEQYEGVPHGWVQWKGTDVCMDVWCKCGAHHHIDAAFAYHVKCATCGTVYCCNGHIELIELEETPEHCVVLADG